MKEIWKDIENYEGIYQVSNIGRVKSLDRYVNCSPNGKAKRFLKGIVLRQISDKDGYQIVNLKKHQEGLYSRVHRLVAQAFIPNTDNKPQVNHIDGVKYNNIVTNIEWATLSENRRHAYDTGLQDGKSREGVKNNFSKLNELEVLEIRKMYKKGLTNYKEIASMFNVTSGCIQRIITRTNWKFI